MNPHRSEEHPKKLRVPDSNGPHESGAKANGTPSRTKVLGEKGDGKKNDEGTFESSLLGVLALKIFQSFRRWRLLKICQDWRRVKVQLKEGE